MHICMELMQKGKNLCIAIKIFRNPWMKVYSLILSQFWMFKKNQVLYLSKSIICNTVNALRQNVTCTGISRRAHFFNILMRCDVYFCCVVLNRHVIVFLLCCRECMNCWHHWYSYSIVITRHFFTLQRLKR